MSLLSPESLHIFYGPAEVLALSRVGWRGRLGETRRYAVAAADGEPWQAPLTSFAAALRDLRCRRVRVVLSHHFVQYRVLPWRADLSGDAEYRALAQIEFSEAFGALADAWIIGLSDEPPGVPRVAAAMPSGLLTALAAAATEAGAKLVAVQPYLAVVERLWQRRAGSDAARWLLVHEPGRVCAAVRQGDAWRWVRHLRVADDWLASVPDLLAGEALLAGLDAAPADVHVFAPGAGREAASALRQAGFQVIEPPNELGFAADRDGAFAPAWFG